MTTIAYRDGELAADSAVFDRGCYYGETTKIFQGPDGSVFGVAGRLGDMNRFRDWMARGEPKEDRPAFDDNESEAIVIRVNGRVEWFGPKDNTEITGKFHAIGSGFRIAMGAMAAGASAKQAVQICADLDDCTRGPISVLWASKAAYLAAVAS